MHFFDWAKKCQETHQHCMLDRTLFLLAQKKLSKKMLYHMVASRSGASLLRVIRRYELKLSN